MDDATGSQNPAIGPAHFSLADRLLTMWRERGYEVILVRADGRAVPAMEGDLGDTITDVIESYLIGAAGARDAIARSAASGWRY